MILRDKDANTAWASAADSTREERLYYCQNFRHDVVQTLTSAGVRAEKIRYTAYGIPFGSPVGDVDFSGQVSAFEPTYGGYDVREDFNLDGFVSGHDDALVNIGQTLGWNALSRANGTTGAYNGNRKGYAGYESSFFDHSTMHVRNRVYLAELGRWNRRDPIGMRGGMNVYGYAYDSPVSFSDWDGRAPDNNSCLLDDGGSGWTPNVAITYGRPVAQGGKCGGGIGQQPEPFILPCPDRPPPTGSNWCRDGAGGGHGGQTCYRQLRQPGRMGGQQCCYDEDGNLDNNPDTMGTVDLWSCYRSALPNGTCNPIDIDLGCSLCHLKFEYVPYTQCRSKYNEMQCCIREDFPSGSPGEGYDEGDLWPKYRDCVKRVYHRGETFCQPPSTEECLFPQYVPPDLPLFPQIFTDCTQPWG